MKRLLSLLMIICLAAGIFITPTLAEEAAIKAGDYIQMGTFNGEPIIWRCISVDENSPLLVSDRILSLREFDTTGGTKTNDTADAQRSLNGSNLWEESAVRTWLNSTFLANFTTDEKAAIKSVSLKTIVHENDKNLSGVTGTEAHTYNETFATALQNYEIAYAKTATEKVFLPDLKQLTGLSSDCYLAKPTAKAVENSGISGNADLSAEKNWNYYLRTPEAVEPVIAPPAPAPTPVEPAAPSTGDSSDPSNDKTPVLGDTNTKTTTSDAVRILTATGEVKSQLAKDSATGIRPAFYLDSSKAVISSGDGNAATPFVIKNDISAPTVTLSTATAGWGASITASSDESGTIYVVPKGTYTTIDSLEKVKSKLKYTCEKNKKVTIPTESLSIQNYQVYAVDAQSNLSTPANLNITKAIPTVQTTPKASTIKTGQTLGNSALSKGVMVGENGKTVSGSFKWETRTKYMSSAGTYSLPVIFTPTDSTHYDKATINVSVTVTRSSSSGTSGPIINVGGSNNHDAYISGYTDKTFRPDDSVSRAETATILAKLSSDYYAGYYYAPAFPDTPSGTWYSNYVGFIGRSGLMQGDETGYFRPDDQITRAEFAAVVSKFANLPQNGTSPFRDTAGHWAEGYISALYQTGVINGDGDGKFRPDDQITRAEAVKIMNQILGRTPNRVAMTSNNIQNPFIDMNNNHWAYYDILEAAVAHNKTLYH